MLLCLLSLILSRYSSCHHLAAMATCTKLQSKRANFWVFDIFCYIQENIQREHILGLWVYGSRHQIIVQQVCHYGFT